MPRSPRLEAPGVLCHVMVRGLDRCTVFRDQRDRADFVRRLGALAGTGAIAVQEWALLPGHVHRLAHTGARPLPHVVRSLLTGYAGAFNRRHKRTGHQGEGDPAVNRLTRLVARCYPVGSPRCPGECCREAPGAVRFCIWRRPG